MPILNLKNTLIALIIAFAWAGTFLLTHPPFAQYQHPPTLPNPSAFQPQTSRTHDSYTGILPYRLTRTPAETLEQTLRQLCGERFITEYQHHYTFIVDRKNVRRECSMRIDPQLNQVFLLGDKQLCDQVFILITAIDQPPPHGMTRHIIPYHHAPLDLLTQAFESYRTPAVTSSAPKLHHDTTVRRINPHIANPRIEAQPLSPDIVQVGYGTTSGRPSSGHPAVVRVLNPEPNVPLIPPRPLPRMPMSDLATDSPYAENFHTTNPLKNAILQTVHQIDGGLGGGFESMMPMRSTPTQNPMWQSSTLHDGQGVSGIPGNQMVHPMFDNPHVVGVPDDFRFVAIPHLDIIVVEAEGPRLNRFVEMIRQIEEISKINRPKIEVVYLKHVNNVSLGGVLLPIYDNIFQTVPGVVWFTPMTSPNAIMLVGWGEAMDTAKELIETLDQPTATEHSRLHIFKLNHISAQQARTVLQGSFPPPQPLSGFVARIQLFHEPRSNAIIVQAAPNDLDEVKRILIEIDVPDSSFRLQVKTKQLRNSLAPDVQQTITQAIISGTTDGKIPAFELLIQGPEGQRLIKSGIMSDVTVSSDVRNNQIIIRSPENSMAFIEELIGLLDIASPEAEIKVFQVEHGDADSLMQMLTSLIPSNVAGSPGPQLPGTADGDSLIPIRFAVDVRTNTIVAAGSASDLKTVEALIMNLDREDMLSRESRVYPLKNMKSENVAATINEYIRSRRDIRLNTPGVIPPFQQIESEVIVVPDVESNSLIISATPRYFNDIIKLVGEIDRSPPQVVIRVLIAEVTLSDAHEWSAEIGLQDPVLLGRSSVGRGGMLFNSNPNTSLGTEPGTSPGTVASQLLSNFGGQRIGPAGFSGLAFAASSDYIHMQLRALHEDKRLEVLSAPQIMTINNQEAVISIGQKVPRMYGTVETQLSSRPDIRDEDVSLMLTVQPSISPEGTIVMRVIARNQKLGAMTQVGDQIMQQIDDTNIATMISAADKETVVLGGLITKQEDTTLRKIPFLGDIPLVGKFFRQELSQTQRKELLIILTPSIVRSPEDIDRIRQAETARMNWCMKNVADIYGDVGAYSISSARPYTGNAPVITPPPVSSDTLQPIEVRIPAPVLPKRN